MRTWMRQPPGDADRDGIDYEPRDIAGLFASPRWLRDLGVSAWLAVGVTLFLVGAVWLLSLTHTIVLPVITATVIAAVATPLVHALSRRMGRGAATAFLLLCAFALALLVVVAVLGGITGQSDEIRGQLGSAKDTLSGWLTDVGVDSGAAN